MSDKETFRLSHPQMRIFYTELTCPATDFAWLTACIPVAPKSSAAELASALRAVLEACPELRLEVRRPKPGSVPADLRQYYGDLPEESSLLDVTNERWQGAKGVHSITRSIGEPWDRPLYKFTYFAKDGMLALSFHHGLTDGPGMQNIADAFAASLAGKTPPKSPDFLKLLEWEDSYLASEQAEADSKEWVRRLTPLSEPLEIRGTNSGEPRESRFTELVLPPALTKKSLAFCEARSRHGRPLSPFRLALALCEAFFSKWFRAEEFMLETAAGLRTAAPELGPSAAMMVSTLPLKACVKKEMTFEELLSASSTKLSEAVALSKLPFENISDAVRKSCGTPLLAQLAIVHNGMHGRAERVSVIPPSTCAVPLCLRINAEKDDAAGLQSIKFEYIADLFTEPEIESMKESIAALLENAIDAPQTPVCGLSMLSERQRAMIFNDFNATDAPAAAGATVVERFLSSAEKWPRNDAVIFKDEHTSYSALEKLTASAARRLKELGAGPGTFAALVLPRSSEMIYAIWSVLRAGAAYVPIGCDAPDERTRYMIEDAAPAVIIAPRELRDRFSYCGGVIITPEELFAEGRGPAAEHAEIDAALAIPHPQDAAYMIYTSGTTGNPKGVIVPHEALANFCGWATSYLDMKPGEGSLSYLNYTFDASITDIFTPLCSGGHTALLPKELMLDMEGVHSYAEACGAAHTCVTTQVAEQLALCRDSKTLKTVIFGGEKMRPMKPRSWRLINCYGPTEFTVACTAFEVTREWADKSAPIGRPLSNLKAWIVDGAGNLCPAGAAGELLMSGPQAALGYKGRADLTSKVFISNPFANGREDQKTAYRTGDLCVLQPDGNIEYMGRIDRQVKIRGFRVEPGEIEQRLMELPDVKNAVVRPLTDARGTQCLCAWIVPLEKFDSAAITSALSKRLPAYMIPSFFMPIEAVPFNASNKVDARALPIPDFSKLGGEYEEPATETEHALSAMWRKLIGAERAGRRDDFMLLGGNSLSMIEMQNAIFNKFGASLPIGQLFEKTELAQMARLIDESKDSAQSGTARKIAKAPAAARYPASPAQRQMFIMQMMDAASSLYNIPFLIEVRGDIDLSRLSDTLDRITALEPSLRTIFESEGGEVYQVIQDKVYIKKNLYQVKNEQEAWAKLGEMNGPFSLKKGPLLRAALARVDNGLSYLLIVTHHSVADGVTVAMLLNEVGSLYRGDEVPQKDLNYADYSVWRAQYEKSAEYDEKARWWRNQFADGVPALDLITDRKRPAKLDCAGAVVRLPISAELIERASALSCEAGGTRFIAFLGAWALLLGRYARTEDIAVGMPFSGRTTPESADIAGMFVSTLPLRIRFAKDMTVRDFMQKTAKLGAEARARQDYALESLVEALGLERDASHNPIFDCSFNMVPYLEPAQAGGVTTRIIDPEGEPAHFDLTLRIAQKKEGWQAELNFRTSLFEKATAEAMLRNYLRMLEEMVSAPEKELSALKMTDEDAAFIAAHSGKAMSVPAGATFGRLFEEAAARFAERTAAADLHRTYTYKEFEKRTRALAAKLLASGAARDKIIGVMLPRRAETAVAIVGILRSGAAYLPIDLEYPQERIAYMLADSGAETLICCAECMKSVPASFKGRVIDIYDEANFAELPEALPQKRPDDMAYAIYTSGSTGSPKGVVIDEGALANHLIWAARRVSLTEKDAAAVHASFSFDSSVKQLLSPLITGAAAWIVPEEMRLDIGALSSFFKEKHITAAYFPTKVAELFMELGEPGELRFVMYGGEKASVWKDRPYKLINCYGPTEFTVNAATFEIDRDYENIPIGRPVANSEALIVDAYGNLQPDGAPGELCMAGPQAARGYLNRPELTKKAFVKNPWARGAGDAVLYRTGDLCRVLPSGEIEYLGRIDKQVKIRGFRIEPGEIEENLNRQPGIKGCAVICAKDRAGEDCLAAYAISDAPLDATDLAAALAKKLPEYMVPSYWVRLEKLPLNQSGKLDARALPRPWIEEAAPEAAPAAGPVTEKQRDIARLWTKVLGREEIGMKDNFFKLGGTSLSAIHLVSLMQKRYCLSITTLFENQTLEALCEAAEENPGQLAKRLDEIREKLSAAPPAMDAAESARLAEYEEMASTFDFSPFDDRVEYSSALLTGATGYLGSYVLRELRRAFPKMRVTAIVRGTSDEEARARLAARLEEYFGAETGALLDNVTVFAGDIEKPGLGLTPETLSGLADETEAVINCAANVRHYGAYEKSYSANVGSVKNLAAFAQIGRTKELLHISTVSVGVGDYGRPGVMTYTENDRDRGQESGSVYVRTKLEAEEALAASGCRFVIARVGNIAFNHETGAHQSNLEENAFYLRMRSSVNCGFAPASGLAVEFSYVDELARAIVLLLGRPALSGRTVHVQNSERHELGELLTAPQLGLAVQSATQLELIDKYASLYDKKGFGKWLEQLFTHMGWLDAGYMKLNSVKLCSEWSDALMAHLGFAWSPLNVSKLLPLAQKALAERCQTLAKTDIFRSCSAEELYDAARRMSLRIAERGDLLRIEGDDADKFCILEDGLVEVSKRSEYGWECTLSVLNSGSCIGEEGCEEAQSAITTLEAIIDDALLLEMTAEDFRSVLQKSAAASEGLSRQLLKRLAQATFLLANAG